MKNSTLVAISLVSTAVITASAAVALAEPAAEASATYRGIENAFELALSPGYTQGVGDIDSSSTGIDDLTGAGAQLEVQAGYRVTPNLAVLAYGTFSGYANGSDLSGSENELSGITAGLQAAWHFRPATEVDPWVSLGAGARYLSIDEDPGMKRELFGIDAARVQAGVDFRLSPMFALGPVIGASVTKFVWDERMDDGWNEIEDRELNFHFSAGVMGRFDGPISK